MPTHLAPTEILADYANGSTSPGVALLVASHLTYAPEARATVSAFESVGGALLADETPAQMSCSALDDCLKAIGAPGETPPPAARPLHPALPAPVAAALAGELGLCARAIPWRFRLPGVSEYELTSFEGEHVSLLRAKPGTGIPQHTHEGTELTLVLCGAMEDGGQVYEAGDLAVNSEHDDHRPRIVGDEVCICLVVMDGQLRFTGRFSRALNLLAE